MHMGALKIREMRAIPVDDFFEVVLSQTQVVGEAHSKIVDPFVKMEIFYDNVKTGGAMDLKNSSKFKSELKAYAASKSYKSSARGYSFRGQLFELQDFGNYNFGVYSKAIGYSLNFVKSGAGLYQIWSRTSSWKYIRSKFDDPQDAKMIEAGYKW